MVEILGTSIGVALSISLVLHLQQSRNQDGENQGRNDGHQRLTVSVQRAILRVGDERRFEQAAHSQDERDGRTNQPFTEAIRVLIRQRLQEDDLELQ